jgi:uncharacterized membrane protein (DUF485 family)
MTVRRAGEARREFVNEQDGATAAAELQEGDPWQDTVDPTRWEWPASPAAASAPPAPRAPQPTESLAQGLTPGIPGGRQPLAPEAAFGSTGGAGTGLHGLDAHPRTTVSALVPATPEPDAFGSDAFGSDAYRTDAYGTDGLRTDAFGVSAGAPGGTLGGGTLGGGSRLDAAARTAVYLEVQRGAAFQEVRRRYRRFAFPATAAFLAWYLLYVVLATTAPSLMARPVGGGLNVGLVAGLAQFATTFLLTWAYALHARVRRDPAALDLRWETQERMR